MSEESENKALHLGHQAAMTALKAQKSELAALPSAERLYYWFGFVTAGMGAALASLGEPAFRTLRRSLADNRDIDRTAITACGRGQIAAPLEWLKNIAALALALGPTKNGQYLPADNDRA
jgi:hypothetical protein